MRTTSMPIGFKGGCLLRPSHLGSVCAYCKYRRWYCTTKTVPTRATEWHRIRAAGASTLSRRERLPHLTTSPKTPLTSRVIFPPKAKSDKFELKFTLGGGAGACRRTAKLSRHLVPGPGAHNDESSPRASVNAMSVEMGSPEM